MKIPDNAFAAEFIGLSEVSYYPRKNSSEKSLAHVCLPRWLSELIRREINDAHKQGCEEAQHKIQEALGIQN